MFLNKRYRYRYRCVLEAVVLLLLSLFSGTTALLKPNGQPCGSASECESGACSSSPIRTCVDKSPLGGFCTLDAPCANPENTTCNFQFFDTVGSCDLARKAGEECSNKLPQRRCIESSSQQLECIQRSSSERPKCLVVLSNGQEVPEPFDQFVCDGFFPNIGNQLFCSDENPGDICNGFVCRGPDCSGDNNLCVCRENRCFKPGSDGEDCIGGGTCLPGLKCLFLKVKCTAGVEGSPCMINADCKSDLDCIGAGAKAICARKTGGIGQPCIGGLGLGRVRGSCAAGLLCSGRRGTCGCRPVLGCP